MSTKYDTSSKFASTVPSAWGNSFKTKVIDQLSHNNYTGMENTPLPLIAEPLRPGIFEIGGLQPFRRTGASLYGTMIKPPIIHCNQATATIARWVHSDRKVSLTRL